MMQRFLFLLLFLLFSCSMESDGPMDPIPSDAEGEGFVMSAVLDSGRRVHATGDTLSIKLDSIWMLSPCFLQSIVPENHLDTVEANYHLGYRFPLRYENDVKCPLLDVANQDTLLKLPPDSDWKKARIFYLWGGPRSAVTILDSILLMDGFNEDSLFLFSLDSQFLDPYALPRTTGGSTAWVTRILRKQMVDTLRWQYLTQTCMQPRSNCLTVADTAWPIVWIPGEINRIPVRKRCEKDSTTFSYCLGSDWTDSLALPGLYSKPDTTWEWGTFFVEPLRHGTLYNRDSLISYTGSVLKIWRELFVPSDSLAPDRFGILHLETKTWITDSLLLDSILKVKPPKD